MKIAWRIVLFVTGAGLLFFKLAQGAQRNGEPAKSGK